MKHTTVAFICVGIVFAYSIFTFFYVENFTSQLEKELSFSVQEDQAVNDTENVSSVYDKNKHILMFILNKEYLENMETSIIKLEYAAKHENRQDIQTYSNLLSALLEDIQHHNKCII